MNFRYKLFFLVFLAVLLTACGNSELDATSEESLKESSEDLIDSLPTDQRKSFKDDLRRFIFWHHSNKAFRKKGDTDEIARQRVAVKLHGKNAEGFMLEYKKAQKINALWKMEYYKQSQEPHKYGNKQRARVHLDGYRIYTRKDDGKYYIDFAVLNNSAHTLREVIFNVVVVPKNSQASWEVDKLLRIDFPDGLPVGVRSVKTMQLFGDYFNESPEEMALRETTLPYMMYTEEDSYGRRGAGKHNNEKIESYQKNIDSLIEEFDLDDV